MKVGELVFEKVFTFLKGKRNSCSATSLNDKVIEPKKTEWVNFQPLFAVAPGQPIEYKGETIYPIDSISVPKKFTLSVRLISTNSEWTQLIGMRVKKKGYLLCNEHKGTKFFFKETTVPPVFEVSGYAPEERVLVYYAWESPDHLGTPTIDYWVNGGAMKKVVNGNTIRYYCNDGHFDDDFDDLIFEISIL